MHGFVSQVSKRIGNGEVADGRYPATWNGYLVNFVDDAGNSYIGTSDVENSGSANCEVRVFAGRFSVESQ